MNEYEYVTDFVCVCVCMCALCVRVCSRECMCVWERQFVCVGVCVPLCEYVDLCV